MTRRLDVSLVGGVAEPIVYKPSGLAAALLPQCQLPLDGIKLWLR